MHMVDVGSGSVGTGSVETGSSRVGEERAAQAEKQATDKSVGRIVQITGPVVDVEFEEGATPDIFTALEVMHEAVRAEGTHNARIVLEVEQSLGNNWVRTVAMAPTEGLSRGTRVKNTGQPIQVPVGEAVLGR